MGPRRSRCSWIQNLSSARSRSCRTRRTRHLYEALTRLCRGYGNASVRRAYADWANTLFGSHQDDLAMNGVDLIQAARVGIQNKTPPTSGWPSMPWRR